MKCVKEKSIRTNHFVEISFNNENQSQSLNKCKLGFINKSYDLNGKRRRRRLRYFLPVFMYERCVQNIKREVLKSPGSYCVH